VASLVSQISGSNQLSYAGQSKVKSLKRQNAIISFAASTFGQTRRIIRGDASKQTGVRRFPNF
jgi:hypothetical protein